MYIRKPIEQVLGSEELFCEVCDIYGRQALHRLRGAGLKLHVVEDTHINHVRYTELNNFFQVHAVRGAIKDYESDDLNSMVMRVRYSGSHNIPFKREEFLYVPLDSRQSLRLEIITLASREDD